MRLRDHFPNGLTFEEWDRAIEWCDALYRHRINPTAAIRLIQLDEQITKLQEERRTLDRTLYPEGRKSADMQYVILQALWEGITEEEANERIREHLHGKS